MGTPITEQLSAQADPENNGAMFACVYALTPAATPTGFRAHGMAIRRVG